MSEQLQKAAQAAQERLREAMQGNLTFDAAMQAFNDLAAALVKQQNGQPRHDVAHAVETVRRAGAHPLTAVAWQCEQQHLAAQHTRGESAAVAHQGGLTNDQLMAAWRTKLPHVQPTNYQLTAFALGIEYGAQGADISASRPKCVCGDPSRLGVIHRADAPCYIPVGVYRRREPLTDAEALRLVNDAPALESASAEWLHVIRAVERAHGIGKESA